MTENIRTAWILKCKTKNKELLNQNCIDKLLIDCSIPIVSKIHDIEMDKPPW